MESGCGDEEVAKIAARNSIGLFGLEGRIPLGA